MVEPAEIDRIVQKLDIVRRRRIGGFGAEEHGFRALPPIASAVVAAFERRHRIQLPTDYRLFITTVLGGGMGPGYGLIPFEEAASFEADLPPDTVERPFPYVVAYNPYEDPTLADFWAREGRGQLPEEEYARQKAKEVSGTLQLSHEGCGYYHLLVVNGPARGAVWIDGTVSDAGYVPLGVGFAEWYERWLDSLLAGDDGVWWMQERGGAP